MTAREKSEGTAHVQAKHGRDDRATGDGARVRQGAYLPHWTREGGIYFVTFRLADSLPRSVVKTWRLERQEIVQRAQQQGRPLTVSERQRLQELFSQRVEKQLDAGLGACWRRRPEIADLVLGALQHFDEQRYVLLAWCVMPNHVHVVIHSGSPNPTIISCETKRTFGMPLKTR